MTFAETALKENEFALETPYEISDDQPLYIGYYFLCNGKNEGYIPVDGYPSAEPGGLIATSAGSKWPGKKIGRTSLPVMAHAVSLLRWRATTFLRIMSAFSPRSSRKSVTTGGKLTYKILIRNKGAKRCVLAWCADRVRLCQG